MQIKALTQWRAKDWEDLESIWLGLMGNADDLESTSPIFREHKITARDAGYVFQTWVVESLRLSNGDVELPFQVRTADETNVREEIDGVLYDDGKAYLLESKFVRNPLNFEPIARLHLMAERRPPTTIGLIFAPFGFTAPAVESAQELRPLRVLLLDRPDIELALRKHDMLTVVRVKYRDAVKYGRTGKALTMDQL